MPIICKNICIAVNSDLLLKVLIVNVIPPVINSILSEVFSFSEMFSI